MLKYAFGTVEDIKLTVLDVFLFQLVKIRNKKTN